MKSSKPLLMSPKAPATKGFTWPNLVLREATRFTNLFLCWSSVYLPAIGRRIIRAHGSLFSYVFAVNQGSPAVDWLGR